MFFCLYNLLQTVRADLRCSATLVSEAFLRMKPYPYTRRYNDRGKVRIEYRRYGRNIALTGEPGTMEFQQSYEAAKERIEGATILPREDEVARRDVVKQGTLRWLCIEWFKSPEFGQFAPTTQHVRRRILEHILQEPSDQRGRHSCSGSIRWLGWRQSTSRCCGTGGETSRTPPTIASKFSVFCSSGR